MNRTHIVMLAAAAGLIAAQQVVPVVPTAVAAEPLEQITVIAPRIRYIYERGRRFEMAEQTALVDVSDLDLTRTADLYRLESRVRGAAERICSELAATYPIGEPSESICVQRAVSDSMELVASAVEDSLEAEATTAVE